MIKHLNTLGCDSKLLNILLELAQDSNNYNNFNIFKNTEVVLDSYFHSNKNFNIKVYEPLDEYKPLADELYALSIVGIKSKEIVFKHFKNLFNYNKNQFINLIHPKSYVSVSSKIDYGLQVEPLSIISSCSEIGFAVNIKRGCSIGHHCKIGDYVTINPGTTISSSVEIGNNTMIGSGTSIIDGITIGSNSIIGVGSVVVKNIPAHSVAFGNPCKVKRLNY